MFFSLGEATSLGELKLVKLRLKIDLVSYPARAEGLGKYGYLRISLILIVGSILTPMTVPGLAMSLPRNPATATFWKNSTLIKII